MTNNNAPASLDALLGALNNGDTTGLPMKHGGLDMTSLPTFGGEEPTDTSGVWSYDPTRLLVDGTDGTADYKIVPRGTATEVMNTECLRCGLTGERNVTVESDYTTAADGCARCGSRDVRAWSENA